MAKISGGIVVLILIAAVTFGWFTSDLKLEFAVYLSATVATAAVIIGFFLFKLIRRKEFDWSYPVLLILLGVWGLFIFLR